MMRVSEPGTKVTAQPGTQVSTTLLPRNVARGRVNVLYRLQRTIGNRAVRRMMEGTDTQSVGGRTEFPGFEHGAIQAKLIVNEPGDKYEQEADLVADHVVRITSGPAQMQRKCDHCAEEEKKENSEAPFPAVAKQTLEGQDDEYPPASQNLIFRKAEFAASPTETLKSLPDRLSRRQQSAGEPLTGATLQGMQDAFGRNFSDVRIHRDAAAAEISEELGALAFTHSNHIFFGSGRFDPEGSSGKHLLAHELTHVVQQGKASQNAGAGTASASDGSSRAVPGSPSATPGIQRVANWGAGAVHQTNNLANSIMNGPPLGVTWPTLNGTIFWSTTAARAALHKPTLAFSSAASGNVTAQVATVPTNTGSFDETVLAPGPWTTTVPKTTVGAMFSSLTACSGAGNSTFQAIGDPSDAHMFAANRRHEDHHAADHKAAFNGSLVPWDTALTNSAKAGTTYSGATQADAEAALHAAMGGTPDQVADAFMNACAAAVAAFHSTPAGGPCGAPTSPASNADCSTSSAKFHNPS